MSKVAVCIPTYNEKENITAIIKAVHAQLPEADVFIVDDNSPDGTADIVREMMKENSFVLLKVRRNKEGLGAAYLDGFSTLIEKGYEKIIQMDAPGMAYVFGDEDSGFKPVPSVGEGGDRFTLLGWFWRVILVKKG